MKSSLSKRITFGYVIIILTALLASAYCIVVLQRNRKLDDEIKTVYLPLYLGLKDIEAINREIAELNDYLSRSTFSHPNKLIESIYLHYLNARRTVNGLASHLPEDSRDSVLSLVSLFDKVITYHRGGIAPAPQQALSNVAVPLATRIDDISDVKITFDTRLSEILKFWQTRIDNLQEEKKSSDTFLSFLLVTMIGVFAIVVVIVYFYLRKTIVEPIIGVKDLIVTLGEGRPVDVHVNGRSDEIGKITQAVSSLTQCIRARSEFATKVGQGNYTEHLRLLSEEDAMGRALLNMRDNLKRSVEEEQKRAHENKRLATVVNRTTNIVILADGTGKIDWVNPAFARITGYEPGEVIGKNFDMLIRQSHVDEHLIEFGKKMMYEGQGFKDVEIISYTREGTPYWVSVEVQPILTCAGHVEQFIVVGTDISERKAAQKNLEERNAELEKINSELDRFVYSASHDLRAPIASLLGLIEIARLEKDPKTTEILLDRQKDTLLRLDRFIKDIINYSRNARLDVEAESIDFESMIKNAFDQLQYMDNVNKIRKIVSVHQTGKFYSSPTRISMVLSNLIANGIKYADLQKKDPFLKITVEATTRSAEISICDNGEGIPEDAHEKIFNMFYRASENSSGSGLGLYIAKEALQKIGGEIQLKSEYRCGTEFTISIPSRSQWN